ncbi:hypothetical protein, variant 1 [Verruconis gallopava]|nr:hypothetical protein, variant 1 [Verruconis gallopava]KIV98713.1 hypothetical protein, variant 1 [Verruconis gallopava]
MEDIERNLKNDAWSKEYDFGIALYEAFHGAHDGHFYFTPDIVGGVFNWARPIPLVSVSSDGEAIPAPFAYSDILAASQGNASFTPSAIVKINGQDATDFLLNLSQQGSLQDRDALYNLLFYNLAQISLGSQGSATGMFSGGGRGRLNYPGPTTELEFANGTKASFTNTARVLVDFTGIQTGTDLYQRYFAWGDLTVHLDQISPNSTAPYGPPSMSPQPTSPVSSSTPTSTPAPGYPTPVIRQTNNLIGGYFLEGEGVDDVAVLSVPSFVSLDTAEQDFQQVGEIFLKDAKAAGKKKLIIDVSANGGGTILQGYDLFKQLFPSVEPYAAADRIRATESVKLIGEVYSEFAGRYPRDLNQSVAVVGIEADVMNYRSDLVADTGKHFDSWTQKFGPEAHQGDYFSSRFRWDLSDPLIQWNSGGINIHGYGPLASATNNPQPFEADNIVILYDGYCASTCTIFSELMRQLGHVKTVAIGGRPNTNPIQAVGGTKGTNDLPWDYIQSEVESAFNYSTPAQHDRLLKSELMEYNSYLPFYRAVGGATAINFRDGIRKGDEENMPLQFRYEEADCRIFYEPAHVVDAAAMWKKVADVRWNGGKCVAGGFGDEIDGGKVTKRAPEMSVAVEMAGLGLPPEQVQALRKSFDLDTDPVLGRRADGFMYP